MWIYTSVCFNNTSIAFVLFIPLCVVSVLTTTVILWQLLYVLVQLKYLEFSATNMLLDIIYLLLYIFFDKIVYSEKKLTPNNCC